ncbi:HemK family protein methyltransferase [Patescibacteria group bacterium]|nr:HemK family protein methyltransferase [Patescibacteria group bacterium]
MKTVKFLNCKIDVSKRVFVPRPETEFWTKLAIAEIKRTKGKKKEVLDIFSATGCVGVSVLKNIKNSFCDFVDIDENALEEIKINLKINKIERGRYGIIKSDVFEKINKKYDFILANPPYVALERISEVQPRVLREEPYLALFGGRDGLDYIRRFLREVKNQLKPMGKFYLEFDPRQKAEIDIILRKEGYKFKFKKDQFKEWRFLVGSLNSLNSLKINLDF